MKIVQPLSDAFVLCRVFLRSLRFWGPFAYVLAVGVPLFLFFFMMVNLGEQAQERMSFLLSATLLVGFIGISVTSVAQYLVQLRLSGGFAAYQALPIHPMSLISGIVLYYLVSQLPVILAFVALIPVFGFTGFFNGFFFLSLFMSIAALIPVGGFIGLYSRSIEQGAVLSLAVSFTLYMFAPIYFPIEYLPSFARPIARVLPTTYLAENLRMSLLGAVDVGVFARNAGIILGYAVVLYVLMARRLRLVSDE